MTGKPDNGTMEQALTAAHHDATNMITVWQNIGNLEFKGHGAAFAYQIAAVVLGGLTVGRWLETLSPEAAREGAVAAHEKGFTAVTVPDDWVMLYGIACSRAHITGMRAHRQGLPPTANINAHLRDAARDVLKIFGEGASPTIKRLAELDDEGLRRQGEMWSQRNSLIYEDAAGRA